MNLVQADLNGFYFSEVAALGFIRWRWIIGFKTNMVMKCVWNLNIKNFWCRNRFLQSWPLKNPRNIYIVNQPELFRLLRCIIVEVYYFGLVYVNYSGTNQRNKMRSLWVQTLHKERCCVLSWYQFPVFAYKFITHTIDRTKLETNWGRNDIRWTTTWTVYCKTKILTCWQPRY